jgi:23S rRNA (adenine2503-C2)-methyltransferase
VIALRDLRHAELEAFVAEQGEPRFRSDQLFRWLHARGVTSWEAMTDLPAGLRSRLAAAASLTPLALDLSARSADGTRKLRLRTADGRLIESVLIPEDDKLTLCVSSQVGCALDCTFCATATLGFGRQLAVGEIVDQVYRARVLSAEDGRRITNLVFMGMGEPLHNLRNVAAAIEILTHELGANLSHRRITVSTAGLVPGIEKLGQSALQVNLAISLNATTDAVRDELMPINRRWPIAALLGAVRRYPLERRRRVTFEYVLLAGRNDSDADADRLPHLLRGIPAKVNLIPWNPHPGAPYQRPSWERVEAFQNRLKAGGLAVYVRRPRGDDIAAACGQLAASGSGSASASASADADPAPDVPAGGLVRFGPAFID